MRTCHFCSVESLEGRRLFAALTLDVDETQSSVTAAATLNNVPLIAQGQDSVTATLDGTVEISQTARGIKFLAGSAVTATTEEGDAASLTFGVVGQQVSLDDLAFGFSSTRINTEGGKFTATRIETDTTAGEVNFTAGGTPVTISGLDSALDYSVVRVKTNGDGALRLTIPFNFTLTANYTQITPQVLAMTFSGQLVARVADGASAQAVAASVAAPAAKKDSVADDVLG